MREKNVFLNQTTKAAPSSTQSGHTVPVASSVIVSVASSVIVSIVTCAAVPLHRLLLFRAGGRPTERDPMTDESYNTDGERVRKTDREERERQKYTRRREGKEY